MLKLVKDLPADKYHAGPEVSNSLLKQYRISCQHGLAQEQGKIKHAVKSLEFGSGWHASTLEPGRFDLEYTVRPQHYRAPADHARVKLKDGDEKKIKAGDLIPWHASAGICKEWEAQQTREIISYEDMEHFRGMRESILAHPAAGPFLRTPGQYELSAFDTCPETGLALRCRFDKLTDQNTIVDIKSTVSARPHDFINQAARLFYNGQAAFYQDMLTRGGMECSGFVFIAVEKKPPYAVLCMEFDDEAIAKGRSEYQRLLRLYKKCHDEKHWPGYIDGDMPARLSLPRWALDSKEMEVGNYEEDL